MTPIEDLLRQALREAPGPVSTRDPLPAVQARVRRARTAAVAVIATAVVVAAAVVVPLLTLGRGDHVVEPIVTPRPKPSAAPQTAVWRKHETYAVASDGTSIWTATRSVDSVRERWFVVRQDALTGRELQRIEVPGPVEVVAVGLGRIWAGGGGDGAYPDGVVDVVDPGTGHVATHHYSGAGPSAFAFEGGAAWAAMDELHRVDRLDVGASSAAVSVGASVPVALAPNRLVSTADGSLWANEFGRRQIAEIVVDAGRPRVGASLRWPGPILGPLGRHTFWTSAAPRGGDVRSLEPRELACCPSLAQGYRLAVPGRPFASVLDGRGGLYVAVMSRRPGIAYFADYAHQEGNAPTAFLPVKNAFHLAADPAGGVVYTANGAERLWVPTGR